MDGTWLEDGSFEAAPGAIKAMKAKGKGKGKGKKGKGKDGKDDEGPLAKKPRLGEPGENPGDGTQDEFDWENDWKDKQICLINLKAAGLNGTYGIVKEHLGVEEVIVDGKKKRIRRFLVALEDGKGEKSIKFENLFKVMTGSLVKLRGLDAIELNDSIAECGKLDAATMRYDVTLSDGRHIKVKPSNAEFYARFETTQVAGTAEQMEWLKNSNSLRDRLDVLEWYDYPVPQLLPAAALDEYAKKFPKSVVIGRSNAANPKGAQVLSREFISASRISPGSRVIFSSMPREKSCVSPLLADMRHDELLRLGKFAGWVTKRCAPRQVFFLLPGTVTKGPPNALLAGTCAWPLYLALTTDVVLLESDRWKKSPWARLDALMAVWARKPVYLLPEKYTPPMELPNSSTAKTVDDPDESADNAAKTCPLSFKAEEPFTISRPTEGAANVPGPLLGQLADRAAEAEGSGGAKVQQPTLAVRRLG